MNKLTPREEEEEKNPIGFGVSSHMSEQTRHNTLEYTYV